MKSGRGIGLFILVLCVVLLAALLAARVGLFGVSDQGDNNPVLQQDVSPSPHIPEGTSAPTLVPQPTPSQEPTPTPTPESEPTLEPDPYADKPDIDISDWKYVLANQTHLLGSDFIPEVSPLENGHYFDSRAVDALKAFIKGARDAGLSVYLTSSYRPYATQEYLFNKKVAEYGGDRETAARIVAIPGSSEHQTGLAADICDQYYQYMNESLADTALSKWMKAHCAEYGFILRFPEDKQAITGIMFEPWHFRYVGEEAAEYIMEKGLCLEEFVALYELE